jgi:hypothetical protein
MTIDQGLKLDSPSKLTYVASRRYIHEITHLPDLGIFAAGDVFMTAKEIPNIALGHGGYVILESITILDDASEDPNLSFLFMRSAANIGARNAPAVVSTATLDEITVYVNESNFSTTVDLNGSTEKHAPSLHGGLNRAVQAGPATRSLWVAAIVGNTPTYGASDEVVMKFEFRL